MIMYGVMCKAIFSYDNTMGYSMCTVFILFVSHSSAESLDQS
jgi:hypothetical protein